MGVLLLVLAAAWACGGDPETHADVGGWGDGTWEGTVDTLEDGVPVVRSPATGVWTREEAWRVREELRIGARSGPGADVFSRVGALAVDGYGRVWVGHDDPSEIRVFDAGGKHVRTVGGEGEGPKEFGLITALAIDGRGRVVAVDIANNRYAVWDTAGRFVGVHPRPYSKLTALPWFGAVESDGALWDIRGSPMLPGSTREAVAHDTAFEEVAARPLPMPRDLAEWQEPGGTPTDLIFRLDLPEHVWFSRPREARIVQRRLTGDTVRVIDWSVEPPELSEDERRERLRRTRRRMGRTRAAAGGEGAGSGPGLSDIPERKQLYGGLWVGDRGHLWAPPPGSADGEGVDRIHVFGPEGRYLGPAVSDVPLDLLPAPVFRDGKVWAVTRGDGGVEQVVRARIVRPGEGSAAGEGG